MSEYEKLKSSTGKLSLLEEFNNNQVKLNNNLREDMDLRIIMEDATVMNQIQREMHAKKLEKILSRNK